MRDIEEIKEFTLEVVNEYITQHAGKQAQEFLTNMIVSIDNNEPLNRVEAEMLEIILSEQLKDDMIKALKKNGVSLILEADVQSNYPDAWTQYCRDSRRI